MHYGKAEFQIQMGQFETIIPAMVTDITVEGILGLDLLKIGNDVIEFNSNTLRLNNTEYCIFCEGCMGCYRVVAASDICIPPRSELVIVKKNTFGSSDYIVKPEAKFVKKGRALVRRTLVKGGETVPLRLLNITDGTQQIYKGTMITKMTAADETNTSDKVKKHYVGLRSDVQELLDRCKIEKPVECASCTSRAFSAQVSNFVCHLKF
jgi:ferredoxin